MNMGKPIIFIYWICLCLQLGVCNPSKAFFIVKIFQNPFKSMCIEVLWRRALALKKAHRVILSCVAPDARIIFTFPCWYKNYIYETLVTVRLTHPFLSNNTMGETITLPQEKKNLLFLPKIYFSFSPHTQSNFILLFSGCPSDIWNGTIYTDDNVMIITL